MSVSGRNHKKNMQDLDCKDTKSCIIIKGF